jgi:hypothetical protein
MTFVPDAVTMQAPWAAGDFGWEYRVLADLAARFVDLGGFVVEIDGLSGGVTGEGRGGLPRRHLVLAPIDYVRAIISAGLGFEGDYAERLAGECVVGGSDFDFAPSVDLFDYRFNAQTDRRLRVRTLDFHLKNLPQPSFLVFGGYGVDAEVLRSGRRTIAEHLPIIAVRPSSRADLDSFAATLREIEPSYEWIARPGSVPLDGAGAALRPYHVAVPAVRRDSLADYVGLSSGHARGRGLEPSLLTAAGVRSTPIRVSPDKLVASSGFHATETLDHAIWRWGGALPKLSALVETPAPGIYEIGVLLANAVPGALESIAGVTVNGAVLTDLSRHPNSLFFVVTTRAARHLLIELNCPVRRKTPPDTRQLSIALAEVRLRQLQL